MEFIVIAIVVVYVLIYLYLSKKYDEKDAKIVFGKAFLNIVPTKVKQGILLKEEKNILLEMNSSYDYENECDKYMSEKVGVMVILLLVGIVFAIAFGVDYVPIKSIENIIVKPNYERNVDNSRKEKLQYEIEYDGGKKSGFIDVQVDENITDEQIATLLEEKYNDLVEIVLNKNDTTDNITSDLNFDKEPFGEHIKISYDVSDDTVIDSNGKIILESTEVGSEYPVIVKVNMEYKDVSLPFSIELVVHREAISINDEMSFIEERVNYEDSQVILPTKLKENNGKISWYKSSIGTPWYKIIMGFILLSVGIFYLYKRVLEDKYEERKRNLRLDFPDLINKMTLLVKAGFTPQKAWFIICEDYEKSKVTSRVLFDEMVIAKKEMLKGVAFDEMLLNFGRRCGNKQVLAMVSILVQNAKRGSSMLVVALEQMGRESWEIRLSDAKMVGEKASIRLLIPVGISFLVIIIVVIAPIMMSMNF